MGVVCSPLPYTLLYPLILNINPWFDGACKSSSYANNEVADCLENVAIIDICVPGIVVTVVPTPFVTIAVIVPPPLLPNNQPLLVPYPLLSLDCSKKGLYTMHG
jgi:hypothetical protein